MGKIKPLVWESLFYLTEVAETPIGKYHIDIWRDEDHGQHIRARFLGDSSDRIYSASFTESEIIKEEDIQAAKTACQADFEEKISECFE